ncbi:olfactory receptor 4C15-like [Macrotis lagotis]|uniref:olfactory receptor 4C15-like n=1 Tax=Macrotis lagotis TaxID=92651 RepID=UPI003D6872FA
MKNQSHVTEFILLGLTQNQSIQKVIFIMSLLFYLVTLGGNLFIVLTITSTPSLFASPMYFFLTFLSFLDACFSSAIVPKIIVDSLSKKKTISFEGCMIQVFAGHFFGCVEVIVLTAMAYDRYVAICKPLHYVNIMSKQVCLLFLGVAWVGGFLHAIIQMAFVLPLPFCGPNVINHFVCDFYPLLELACTDTHNIRFMVLANSGFICILIFSLLLVSYGVILYNLRTYSREGRRKALSTCSSHITVVFLVFVPCIFEYARPPTTFSFDKMVEIIYTVLTPFLNPFIYTFRNTEVKNAMRQFCNSKIFLFKKINALK